uniref:CobB/CobQ-like glutamine amidotransferase domain-containing protein n=1 Tax=Odontella aurita TaxID=265563 RepID=A0A7S4IXD0_9STRA|mmetsp:Transcript_32140/g.96300  ORF Transcript_32140/g.96300 Transcript_32140/m.96300 type:complete len:277 (+) Transcript_32140:52-882(+)
MARPVQTPPPLPAPVPAIATKPRCRIGIAEDAAFCFYYVDNLHLLVQAGAELVPFSPLASSRLPPVDALYLGGGYPELHAVALEKNAEMRADIKSFCESGASIFAECGGLMYLADALVAGKEDPKSYEMCGVFPGLVTRMKKRCTMYYATVELTKDNPVFGKGDEGANGSEDEKLFCRGQEFHYSEVVTEEGKEVDPLICTSPPPVIITPERPGATSIPGGYAHRNTFASHLHLFFGSKSKYAGNQGGSGDCTDDTLADYFVRSAMRNSPRGKANM